jgi:hypothetical protein
MNAWRYFIGLAIVLGCLCALSEAVSCGAGLGSCPPGQCCGANGQCGTTDAFCGAGCQPDLGTCKGLFHDFAVAFTATTFDVVDVVYNPEEPVVYVFVNVLGPINVTQANGQVVQYAPFASMEAKYRGMVLQYNTTDMTFMHYAQYGSYANGPSYPEPKADFTFVRALWANDTLWAAYNLGTPQGEPSGALIAFYRNAETSQGLAGLGNTGILRIQTSNLIPNVTDPDHPGVFSFANLTSSDFYFDGSDLHLSGSFTMSPLEIPALQINERPGARGECNDARHDEEDFTWCPGTEDGWNIQLDVMRNSAQLHKPNFVYSQATGGAPRYVKGLSTSGDNDGGIYNCYISNNDYVIVAESGDTETMTSNSTALNRTQTVPASNDEVFCTINTDNTFSFTNLAFNGGQTSRLYAAALPNSDHELVSTVEIHNDQTGTSYTLLNISGVQGVGEEMGYVLQSGYDWAHVTDLYGTHDSEVLVSGTFNGTLSGDPANPITNVHGPANSGSLFFIYYQRSDSPNQIRPSALFSFGRYNVDFRHVQATLTPEHTTMHPKILLSARVVAKQLWSYNDTLLPSTPAGRQAFFWGIYEPEVNTVQGPVFAFPAPSNNPTSGPSTTPTGSSPSAPSEPTGAATTLSASLMISLLFMTLAAILL